ncbi:hypothetical protein GGD83_000509 [Rhodoblastus sphagnicola]|nr:hypothetical protein [Rhodoblastus sphagnicola]
MTGGAPLFDWEEAPQSASRRNCIGEEYGRHPEAIRRPELG